MKSTIKIFTLFLLVFLISCIAPKYVSTIISDNYDEKKNQTTYMVFPFGSLSLPGKWTKTTYNQTSGQQNFKNKDSLETALLINRNSDYPFNKKEMSPNKFVMAFTNGTPATSHHSLMQIVTYSKKTRLIIL